MTVSVNLNIHYTAPDEVWETIGEIYKTMPFYDETSDYPRWASEDILIEASVEPSGLQIYGHLPEEIWEKWYEELKEKLTDALGYEIGEPEDGFDFKYDWN